MVSVGRKHGGRLFLKFAAFAIVLFTVSMICLGALLTEGRRDARRDEMKERWRQVAQILANDLGDALDHGDLSHLRRVAERFGRDDDVLSFLIVDADLTKIYDSRNPDLADLGTSHDASIARCRDDGRTVIGLGEGGRPGPGQLIFPIRSADGHVAVGKLEFSTRCQDEAASFLSDRFGLVALLVAAGSIVGALLLARHIVLPIGRLAMLAERVSDGDLEVTCATDRNDELGDLARSFNSMVGNLKAAREGARIYVGNILESMVDSLIVTDIGPGVPRIRTVNRATLQLLERSEEELIGSPVTRAFCCPERWEDLAATLERTGALNEDTEFETRHGEARPVRLSVSALRSCEFAGRPETCPDYARSGRHCEDLVTGYVMVARDETELRQSRRIRRAANRISEAVHAAEGMPELFRAVHEILGDLMPAENFYIALLDESSNTLRYPYFVDQRDDPPPDGERSHGLTEILLRGKQPIRADSKALLSMMSSGRVRQCGTLPEEWIGIPLVVAGRAIGAMVLQSYDPGVRFAEEADEVLVFISEQVALAIDRKRGEVEHARLSSAVEQAADAILVTDLDMRIVYVNPAFSRITGYDRSEAIGRSPRILLERGGDRGFVREMWKVIASGKEWTGRVRNQRKDGRIYEVDSAVSAVKNAAGETVNFVCVLHDVTHVVQLEEQLRQSQKMEAVGKLAGGIAHDFNNLLSIINGCCELLQIETPPDHPALRRVNEIRRAGQRATALTRQLLAFSRRQVLMPRVVSFNDVVADVERMLRRLIGEDVQLVTHFAEDLGSTRADPGQLEQVIVNLAVNARDAMPDGGTLTLETSNVVLDEEAARMHPDVEPGAYVTLTVRDTGTGIAPKIRDRVFEPFYTTKEQGKGTGLGLSTVYGIVTQSGGIVTVESAPEEGTVFKVCLPRIEEEVNRRPERIPRSAAPTGTGTILLAEDEDGVRDLARDFLEMLGYVVLEAADGEAALEVAAEHEGEIDLLLTDVVMPRLGGRELAERLMAVYPGIRVVYMSGYTDHAAFREGALQRCEAFLAKPFGLGDLQEILDQVREAEPVAGD